MAVTGKSDVVYMQFEHGGCRIYKHDEEGNRDLIADGYQDEAFGKALNEFVALYESGSWQTRAAAEQKHAALVEAVLERERLMSLYMDAELGNRESGVSGDNVSRAHDRMVALAQQDQPAGEWITIKAERDRLQAIVGTLSTWLRDWWRFDERQQHTHTWHDREDFIEELEKLLNGRPSLLDHQDR
ncbi:MAG: hypothetical protein AAF711_00480 [Planctomycetota bacterium]